MKKAFAAIAVVIVSTVLFSCKGHEVCPAYSKQNGPEQKPVQAEQPGTVKKTNV